MPLFCGKRFCWYILADLAFFLSFINAVAGETRYFPQVMGGEFGDAAYQTVFKFVNTGSETNVRLEFFNNDGEPSGLQLLGVEGQPEFLDFLLKRGEVVSFRTSGTGLFYTGFARFTSRRTVDGTSAFIGVDSASGTVMYETAVPSVTPMYEFTAVLDSSENWDTGLAMIPVIPGGWNDVSGEEETELTITLHNAQAEIIAEETVTAPAGQKTSKYIYEIFSEQGSAAEQAGEMEGSITVSSSRYPLAAISSRQRYAPDPFPLSIPTLTIYQVAPLSHTLKTDTAERILVFAPHPDDEALACAGIIHGALLRGDDVCVVLVTCGDAFLSARDRLVADYPGRAFDRDGDGDFDMLDYGVLRHEETLSAMDALGLDPADVVFLGYPDAGIDDLWRSTETYTSPHTGVSEVPASYAFARSVGRPYNRESILSDVMDVIREFRPTLLYSPRDTDHHQDHWSTGRFVSQALTDLREFQTWKAHYAYLVHWEANESGWPHDGKEWNSPTGHAPPDLQVPLSGAFLTPAVKQSVINRYFSQLIGGSSYLQNFSKNSEIFWLEGFEDPEYQEKQP
jgi:LmbE family N-acetylglucosaminyl deacetylase